MKIDCSGIHNWWIDPLLPKVKLYDRELHGEPLVSIDLNSVELKNGEDIVFEAATEDITIKGILILNTGQIFKFKDGELVEDDGSGETALD